MVEKINADELIVLIKKFISGVKNETVGLKTSDYKKEYNQTILNAHFYKAYGGNSKFVNTPWITFLAYKQKTTKGIYPSLFYDRKKKINNFYIGYGISESNKPEVNWNIDFSNLHTNETNTFFRKTLLTIEDENDIDKYREEIISSLDVIIQDFHNQFKSPLYWIYAAGEKSYKWDEFYREGIIALGWDNLGDLKNYHSQEEIAKELQKYGNSDSYPMNNSKANWEFVNKMNIGDIVYVKKGIEPILLGRGVVESDYIYDDTRNEYKSIRKVNWTHNGIYNVDFNKLEIKQWNQKTLTDISENKYKDFCKKIEKVFNNEAKEDKDMCSQPLNQILYGPPGTGKTYNTVIRAMEIINHEKYNSVDNKKYKDLKKQFDSLKQQGQIEFVTFHQSYSYEEFVEGIKPYIPEWGTVEENNRFIGQDGIFKKICKLAERNLYVFDEDQKADFDKIYKMFQEKYETGSSFSNLLNIKYEQNNLVYHYGAQSQDRRIDLNRIKEIFNSGKQYSTAIEFNKDYKGNAALKGYFFNFYRELLQIKNDYIDENKFDDQINQDALKYVLIIDEINRGDVSKIFGELITLIEEDKRIGKEHQMTVTLPYSREAFGVPKNLYIIGTMNTADRSIALLDTALRRRFDFEEMMPKPELLSGKNIEGVDLEQLLTKINDRIKNEYDRDHQIGHSYLMEVENKEQLERAYKNRILPLLNEYFYNDIDSVAKILNCKPNDISSKENWFNVLKEAQKSTKKENEQ